MSTIKPIYRPIEHQTKLTGEQKEAIGLLSIGTFLEYFDVMLYVHMAVLLNELFFPKTDPFSSSLLSAFAFSIAFIFRPIGAVIFGYLGDTIGRKATVTTTTLLMAVTCLTMASLPTYDQIGVMASILVTICRIVQGVSSAVELVGAELYVSEITKPPIQYFTVASIRIYCVLGANFALLIAFVATTYAVNWRYAFLIGAFIALVGSYARSCLRETPEFADAKRRLANKTKQYKQTIKEIDFEIYNKVSKILPVLLFFMECTWPIWFYFAYVHCSNILKQIGMSSAEIIRHNFFVSLFQLLLALVFTFLSKKYHPLKLVKFRLMVFAPFILVAPFILDHTKSIYLVFFIQSFCVFFGPTLYPAYPIIYKYLPVFVRFRTFNIVHALSRAMMYLLTSFGMVYLVKYFGNYGILIIVAPVMLIFAHGVRIFEKFEKESLNYFGANKYFGKSRHDPGRSY